MVRSLIFHEIPQELTDKEFWDLFGRIEHAELDFKSGVPDSILNTIPAMAMTSGGIIVHGVTDNQEIVGCPQSQNTMDRITRRAHECGVQVEIRSISVGGRALTLTKVPEIIPPGGSLPLPTVGCLEGLEGILNPLEETHTAGLWVGFGIIGGMLGIERFDRELLDAWSVCADLVPSVYRFWRSIDGRCSLMGCSTICMVVKGSSVGSGVGSGNGDGVTGIGGFVGSGSDWSVAV